MKYKWWMLSSLRSRNPCKAVAQSLLCPIASEVSGLDRLSLLTLPPAGALALPQRGEWTALLPSNPLGVGKESNSGSKLEAERVLFIDGREEAIPRVSAAVCQETRVC